MRIIIYMLIIFVVSVTVIFSQGRGIQATSYQNVILNGQTNTENSQSHSILKDSTIELKWDDSEPIGYMTGLFPNDTICVTFDAVPGGTLDSVKVALAGAGSVIGGVWELKNAGSTPLGTLLSDPFEVTYSTTTDYPYPVPYDNWATVDLRNFSISTDIPFAVGFIIEEQKDAPGFMVAEHYGYYPYHSFTHFTPPGRTSAWYAIKPSRDSVYIYLIRAYVSTQFPTAVKKTQTVKNYSLSQNFPNPFNPETLIQYSLAEESSVRMRITNLLGETVSELINSVQNAGEHSIKFNAASGNLSSGVYFYSLEVTSMNGGNNFSSVKKLVYMK